MIRPAIVLDAQAIADVWNPWIRDTGVTFNAVDKTETEVAQLIVARITAGRGFLVATDDDSGAILGFGTYAQFRGGSGVLRRTNSNQGSVRQCNCDPAVPMQSGALQTSKCRGFGPRR